MKNISRQVLTIGFLVSVLASSLSAAALTNLSLSASAASAVPGNTLTITESLIVSNSFQAVDSVIGFDPSVFSVSGFTRGSSFSTWTTQANSSPSSGIYDYDIFGSGSSGSYTVLTFTLTTLPTAAAGNSVIYLRQNDGGSISTQVTNDSIAYTLTTAAANPPTVNANDLTINVTSAATPEPATLLLIGLPLAGIAMLRRRARQ